MLRQSILDDLYARIEGLRSKPIAVGFAVHPDNARRLRRELPPAPEPATALCAFTEIPIIEDDRLAPGMGEAYYDREKWQARCNEQNAYENSKISLQPSTAGAPSQ